MATEIEMTISDDDFLSDLSAGLESATEPTPKGGLPDGDYTAKIVGIVKGVTKPREGRPAGKYLNVELEILGPSEEVRGANIAAHFNLNTDKNFEMFKGFLRRVGIRQNSGPEVMAALESLTNSIWNIAVRNKDGFSNIYFNRSVRSAD